MNLVFRMLGLGWVWDKIDGYKTAIAAFGLFLHALAAVILFLAGIVDQAAPLLQAHDLSGLLHLAQGLQSFGQDPNVVAFGESFSKLCAALGVVGLGHKLEKSAVASVGAAQSSTP